jgi:hypothetical protein
MPYCPRCGTQNYESSPNCQQCQSPLPGYTGGQSNPGGQYNSGGPYNAGDPGAQAQGYQPFGGNVPQPAPYQSYGGNQPQYGYAPAPAPRQQVNPGLAVLVSFLWSGAGLLLVPDRVGMGIGIALGAAVIHFAINFIGALLVIGLLCSIPISLALHGGLMFWTYKEAQRYNEGR